MLNIRNVLHYLRYISWYHGAPEQMPLCSDLDRNLPLPDLRHAKVVWPNRYSWTLAVSRLDPIMNGLSRLLPIEPLDVAGKGFDWHGKGGFSVPDEKHHLIGRPCNPKGPNDIRGEIFEVHIGGCVVRCAFDHSDYPIVSTEIHDQVDVYFKCVTPPGPLPSKVVRIGYFASLADLLAKARIMLLTRPPERRIGIYGRFGAWTDSQPLRKAVVHRLRSSSLDFTGGFTPRIYPAYLREMMSAKVAVDLPGQAPITPRLAEAMALGAVVVSTRIACAFPEELIDGVHYVACEHDGSDVVEVCQALLRDDERRKRIAERAMIFFDRNFSTESAIRRILRAAVEQTG